jgi:hypothetical protein
VKEIEWLEDGNDLDFSKKEGGIWRGKKILHFYTIGVHQLLNQLKLRMNNFL